MAAISFTSITDLKINGKSEYTGPGPVVLTWSMLEYSGSFAYGSPSSALVVEDGDSWGEGSGPNNAGGIGSTSYTFTSYDIEHVKNSGNTAEIYISYNGMDIYGEWVYGSSNKVKFTYADSELSQETIQCYIDGQWTPCVVLYYNGESWIESTPYYYDGTEWKTCSI